MVSRAHAGHRDWTEHAGTQHEAPSTTPNPAWDKTSWQGTKRLTRLFPLGLFLRVKAASLGLRHGSLWTLTEADLAGPLAKAILA